jgi:PASTA domain
MSDEREGPPRPDETRQFPPFDDEDDATRIQGGAGRDHPDAGPRSGDETRRMPADDEATALRPPVRRPDATSIMPPVDEAGAAAWAGRAEVRPPQPGFDPEPEWGPPAPPESRGRWWMPIVVGIVALILLALLGWGIWLIVQAQDRNTPAPAPAVTTPIAPPESTEPTTEPPTEEPTTTPPTTEPTATEVTIPALRGLSRDQAQQALSRRGLSSRLRFRTSNDAPAGTVIDSDPEEGQEVPPDTVVTLVIAAEPTTEPTTSTNGPDED